LKLDLCKLFPQKGIHNKNSVLILRDVLAKDSFKLKIKMAFLEMTPYISLSTLRLK
jgi:hypothetical protein